jgi:adenylylsulfate kinase
MDTGFVVWFTGVPATGKSTVATIVEQELRSRGLKVENLDSDEVRANISPNLGYTLEARDENTKRLAFLGNLLARNGVAVLITAVSSLRKFRDRARAQIDNFAEVHVKCPLEECQKRDPKGLYKKAERGEVSDIAGMHQPYEEPLNAEVVLETHSCTADECASRVMEALQDLGYLSCSGKPKAPEGEVYSAEEEEKIKKRLRDLGYM